MNDTHQEMCNGFIWIYVLVEDLLAALELFGRSVQNDPHKKNPQKVKIKMWETYICMFKVQSIIVSTSVQLLLFLFQTT